jgi:hypothetical protein
LKYLLKENFFFGGGGGGLIALNVCRKGGAYSSKYVVRRVPRGF